MSSEVGEGQVPQRIKRAHVLLFNAGEKGANHRTFLLHTSKTRSPDNNPVRIKVGLSLAPFHDCPVVVQLVRDVEDVAGRTI